MLCCRQERGSDVEAHEARPRDHIRPIHESEQPGAESICLHTIIVYTVHDIG